MSQYLVAIYRPDDYDPASEDTAMRDGISALNREMIDANVRVFVGGMQPPGTARALHRKPDGSIHLTDGPFTETKEHIGGFWVLDVASIEEALEWGRKAASACRASVEVRPFW